MPITLSSTENDLINQTAAAFAAAVRSEQSKGLTFTFGKGANRIGAILLTNPPNDPYNAFANSMNRSQGDLKTAGSLLTGILNKLKPHDRPRLSHRQYTRIASRAVTQAATELGLYTPPAAQAA